MEDCSIGQRAGKQSNIVVASRLYAKFDYLLLVVRQKLYFKLVRMIVNLAYTPPTQRISRGTKSLVLETIFERLISRLVRSR